MTAAVGVASLFLASCASGGASVGAGSPTGSGTVGSGTVSPVSSTTPTPPASSTTSGPAPTTTTTTAPPVEPSSGTGAYGYVTAGPTCPVQQQGRSCPPRPVSADVDAHNASGATVASTRSDSNGRYALDLSPGNYTLVVGTVSHWPRCPDTSVVVRTGSATRADLSCDTGIR